MERPFSILLVEDDQFACSEMVSAVEKYDDMVLVGVTNNSTKALELLRDTLPDVMILDLELNEGAGNGLTVLGGIKELFLSCPPYILVTTNNTSSVTYDAVRKLGADFIMSKHQSGYGPQMVVDFLRLMRSVIRSRPQVAMTSMPTESPAEASKRLTKRIYTELDFIGISPKAVGYRYLVDGIQIMTEKPTQNLCSIIAAKYGKSEPSVERAMQNAISQAWRTTPIDDLLSHYTARIRSEKGVPTITEFVCYYANKLSAEY